MEKDYVWLGEERVLVVQTSKHFLCRTLLKIFDAAPPTRQNPLSRTVVVSAVCFSRELANVTPVAFDGLNTKEIVSYNFVMALSDQKGNIYALDFVKNKYDFIRVSYIFPGFG